MFRGVPLLSNQDFTGISTEVCFGAAVICAYKRIVLSCIAPQNSHILPQHVFLTFERDLKGNHPIWRDPFTSKNYRRKGIFILRGRWFQTCQAYRLHVQRLLGSETSLQNLVSGTQIWLEVLPRKLTWNMKIIPLKRKSIFQTSIFGFHVSFRGCIVFFFFQRFWVWVILRLRLRWRDFSNCKLAIAIFCLNEKLAIEWFWLNDVEVDSPALLFPFFLG